MFQKPVISWILYGVCIYIAYLYAICLTEGYNIMILLMFASLFYLDVLLLFFGGVVTGTLLIMTKKRINNLLGQAMIIFNLTLTPYLLFIN